MIPIVVIGIALAAAVLLPSDSPTESPREPEPSAPPPPRPPAPPETRPRGINPALFRPTPPVLGAPNFPTAEQTQTELSAIFQSAYALDSHGRLNVTNETGATALQRRLTELRDIAMRDPRAAEAYDRPEITKYVYLTLPSLDAEARGLLYRMDRGTIAPADVVRQLDREELDFVAHYRGRGNPLQDPFYTNHRTMAFAVREMIPSATFAQTATTNARSIANADTLLNRYDGERRAKFYLRQAPLGELRQVSRFLMDNFSNIDEVLRASPPNPRMPRLLQEILPLLRRQSEEDTRVTALQMTTYISFVMTAQGTNSLERDLFDECRSEFRQTDDDTCRLRAGFQLATESPDEFDNARLRHQLTEHLGRYYARYLSLTPAQRVSQQDLVLEAELGAALTGGQFGPPFTANDIRPILEDVRRQTGLTHIPAARPTPISWSEISQIGNVPIEARVEDLPGDIREMAQRVTVHVPRPTGPAWEGTLWDYLRQNVDTIVLTRQAPYLSDDIGEPEGTANRLFRTVIIDIDGQARPGQNDKQPFEILSTLAHEAYHNDWFHNLTPGDPRLSRASTLNERNAHLFESQVLRQIFAARVADARPFLDQYAQAGEAGVGEEVTRPLQQFNDEATLLMGLISAHRLTGLAANVPLDYPLNDETLWTQIFPHVRVEDLGRYPTVFVNDYLRMRGLTQERFGQETEQSIMASLGLSNSHARRRAKSGRPDTSTAGSR